MNKNYNSILLISIWIVYKWKNRQQIIRAADVGSNELLNTDFIVLLFWTYKQWQIIVFEKQFRIILVVYYKL